MRQFLLTLPVLLVLLSSGCTSTDFCIPGLTCGTVVEETHDVIVIESLQALPSNVPPDGTIRLVAIVSNVADVNAEIKDVSVDVQLYDYCEGLFEKIPDAELTQNKILLRGQKEQVEWTLKALPRTQVPVKTECTLKIRARYPYATKSITTLHLIDYAEMQRRISEGTYKEIGSYQSIGYGPIKPYITVEGTQPIPVSNNAINAVLSLQVKNRGNGFLSPAGNTDPVIKREDIEIYAVDSIAKKIAEQLKKCRDNDIPADGLKLIKGESTKIMCELGKDIEIGNVPVESTKTIQVSIGFNEDGSYNKDKAYWYEFRKEIKVTVEPKF
jgi:hypothetical protein